MNDRGIAVFTFGVRDITTDARQIEIGEEVHRKLLRDAEQKSFREWLSPEAIRVIRRLCHIPVVHRNWGNPEVRQQ